MSNHLAHLGLVLLLVVANFCCSSSSSPAQAYARYTCLSDHVVLETYESGADTTLSFDSTGVILSKGQFHPVVAAIYGILCYDRFQETGDSTYLKKLANQASTYLNPANQMSAYRGKGIKLPYHFPFHDQVPPWFSGMAQGMAISVLLRYRAVTGDHRVDETCHKLAYFMLQPESQGGCIGRLENGWPWIEEYPRSEDAPHVLNGSINAWIGLHEYCQAFPEEKEARMLCDSLLQAFEDNLDAYTKHWWCRYDLGKRDCSPSYMRYHIYQMRHLNQITGRPTFKYQEAIWACILTGMPMEPNDHLARPDYEVAAKSEYLNNGWCVPHYNLEPEIGPKGAKGTTANFYSMEQLQAFLAGKKMPLAGLPDTQSQKLILMQFSRPIHADYITLQYSAQAKDLKIELFALTRDNQAVPLSLNEDRVDPRYWQATIQGNIPERGYDRLVVSFSGTNAGSVHNTVTGLFDASDFELPEYAFYRTSPLPMTAGERYSIMVPTRKVDELMVFYRHHPQVDSVDRQIFSAQRMVDGETLVAPETGHYQFLVVHRVKELFSITGMLRWEKN